MAYDDILASRIADLLREAGVRNTQKKMFGGLAFMVRSKMCLGVVHRDLMVRIDPERHDAERARTGAREMDFTGRPMRGFLFVGPDGTRTTAQLRRWVSLALEFNPHARASSRSRTKQMKKGRRP